MRGGVLPKLASKITGAGNLKQMFLNMVAANDLVFRRGTDCPTLRIEGLTLAGA
jgi:PmbA protein